MSRTGVGIRVLIDGQLLDDGCIDWGNPPEGLVGQGVAAGDGLSIIWGRDTTLDQPAPSSCAFTVIEEPGGVSVLELLTIGSRVDVYADGLIAGPPAPGAFLDPDFDAELRATPLNAVVVRSQQGAESGGWAARARQVKAPQSWAVTLPPDTLQPTGGDPTVWDDIQRAQPGETWTLRARVWAPRAVRLLLRPVLYSAPWASAATILTAPQAQTAGPGWSTLEVTLSPGQSAWVGLYIEAAGVLTWNAVDPTLSWDAAPGTWDDLATFVVERVEVMAPVEGTTSTVLAFSGRVTDLALVFDEGSGGALLEVTAADFLADLGNRYIGDEPWPAEPVQARVQRILSQSGETLTAVISPTLAGITMTWLDVDHQQAAGMLGDVAASVDGVLWAATHLASGPYVRLEDPTERQSLYELELVGGVITVGHRDFEGHPNPPRQLSACDILRDPVTFTRDVADLATRATVTWQRQTVDDEGNPTTEPQTTTQLNTLTELEHGTRNVSLDSLVTTSGAASDVAARLLGRLRGDWRVSGVQVNDATMTTPDADAQRLLLSLLDGVGRCGLPLLITELPAWSPAGSEAPVYLEGGTYRYTGGGWELSLGVSRAGGLGDSSTWDELDPTWVWDAWHPALTWDELRGVAGPLTASTKSIMRVS